MANALLAIYSLLPVVNATTVIIAGIVVGLCTVLSRVSSHIPSWMDVPPIMLIGYELPESVIYSSGFCVVAVGLLYSQSLLFLLRRLLIVAGVKDSQKTKMHRAIAFLDFLCSVSSIVSLVIQAVKPVQENVIYTFFDYVEKTDNTIWHESATFVWWVSEVVHWVLNFILERNTPQLSSILRRSGYKSFKVKFTFAFAAIVCGLVGLFLKPSLPAPQSKVLRFFNFANFCWWCSAVSFFIAYFVQSWQAAILLDHLGIRSYVFGSIPQTTYS